MRVLLIFFILFAAVWTYGTEKGLLFYASYDKGVDADFAKGAPKGSGVAEITQNKGGIKGEALIARAGFVGVELYDGVKYLCNGNLKREAGTVEFYVKPLPGFFMKKKVWRRIFLCTYYKLRKEGKRDYRWFRIDFCTKKNIPMLRVFEQDTMIKYRTHLVKKQPRIEIGKWYHLAYAWNNQGRKLFLNGKLIVEGASKSPLPLLPEYLHVGALPWGHEDSRCLIDELKIWDHAKRPESFNILRK